MPADKIMLIRHAEKPSGDGSVGGVSAAGNADPEELSVRGWQRSGALVRFFAPLRGPPADGRLAIPTAIFACQADGHSKRLRQRHTVEELASALGRTLILTHPAGDADGLLGDALAARGPVLVCWEHKALPEIANRLVGDRSTCPQAWPPSRFDLVWVFDRHPATGKWSFAQVPQMLLPGDDPAPIPTPA